ncbi:hypothetical protein [Bradyrhizobium sp. SZCCHNR1098]|uniref:hypothetical protein n=1 Tax=Bradyrhizobium sp. SZCCHNR1098 TaxID=3057370 RepID=UPI002916446D|nr:hypothetical protein [Bradyrhizobium sp. SZCCHNR1098]
MTQPITVTLSSSGSSPWKLTNWWSVPPQQIGFQATLSGLNGTCQIDVTLQDPSSTFSSSTLTVLQASQVGGPAASSVSFVGAISTMPIAAWRLTQNASGFSQLTALQQGVA